MATQWWRIKAAYLEKGWTYKQLAEHYHLSERTIRTRASKEGWRKDRDKIETEARQTIHARAVRGRVEQLEKLITANEAVIDGLLALAEKKGLQIDLTRCWSVCDLCRMVNRN